MKIGVIGAGNIGANAARLFAMAEHEVMIANSRGPETLQQLVSEIGNSAQVGTIVDAAAFGDVIFISIPFGRYKELPAEAFDGKIVIDSNNYYPDRDGHYPQLDENKTTSSEMLAAHLNGAKIVKAFNTIWFEHLRTQGNTELPIEERRVIFVAADDASAKRLVAGLIEDIGFGPVDTGGLNDGGLAQQPGSAIYNRDITAGEAEALLGSEGY
jgi:predicted dinucleotide-binding enzyme